MRTRIEIEQNEKNNRLSIELPLDKTKEFLDIASFITLKLQISDKEFGDKLNPVDEGHVEL